MKKKGFTLIELLAVIVVLAIIALIVTPVISNIINNVRKQAARESAYGIIEAANQYVSKYMLENNGNYPIFPIIFTCNGEVCRNGNDILKFNGDVPLSGNITIYSSKDIEVINLAFGNFCVSGDKSNVEVSKCGLNNEAKYATYNGKLHVCGTRLCNQYNETFRLTGASYGDFTVSGDEQEYSKKSFKSLKSWGANGFRLFIDALATWNGMIPYIDNEDAYINLLKTVIDNLIANDMYVIVNWNPLGSDGSPLTSNAIDAFTRIANLYPNNPHIIYEIWNEPSASTAWSTIKEYASEVIPVIRNISPDSVILVGTPAADSNIDVVIGDTLSFDNIMYTHHTYAASFNDTTLNKIVSVIEAGIPVFETEWAATPTGESLGHENVYYTHANAYAKLLAKYDISYMFFVFHATKWSYGFVAPGNWDEALPESILTPNAKFFKKILRDDYSSESNLMIANTGSNGNYYRSTEYKDKIASIEFKNTLNVPNTATISWDLSYAKDNSVVGYLLPIENNMYKLIIAANGTINAPMDSSFLFAGLTNLKTIDFTNFKTDKVKMMQNMFNRDSSLVNLDLSGFDVSLVTSLETMFFGNTSLKNIDLSTWEINNKANLQGMFRNCSSLENVNMSKINIASTQNITNIVGGVKDGAKFIVKNQNVADLLLGVNSNIVIELTPSFANDSWSTIISNIRAGKGNIYAPDGFGKDNQAYKTIDLGELGVHTLRVANTTPCTNGETSETACGFVIEFADGITKVAYKASGNTNGGYPNTALYTYVTETIYNVLPQEVKDIIINTNVISGHGTGDTNNIVSPNQKLYLLSMMEIFGDIEDTITYDTAYNTTRQLDYYRLNNSKEARSKTNAAIWWTRTAAATSNTSFTAVQDSNTKGFVNHYFGNQFDAIPAFRIG